MTTPQLGQSRVPWRLVPAPEKHTFYIQNRYRCDFNHRECGKWLTWGGPIGQNLVLAAGAEKAAWKFIPAGDRNTFYIQSKWHCRAGHAGCDWFLWFSVGDVMASPKQEVPWKIHSDKTIDLDELWGGQVEVEVERVQVTGSWQPRASILGTRTLTLTVGSTKESAETRSNTWASKVTASAQVGMTVAGPGGTLTLSSEVSKDQTRSFSNVWTTNKEETITDEFSRNGSDEIYLWQWVLEIDSGPSIEKVTTKTKEYALTKGKWEPPRCLPGWATDFPRYQECSDGAHALPME